MHAAPAFSCADSCDLQALWRVFGDSGDSRKGLPLVAIYSAFFHSFDFEHKNPRLIMAIMFNLLKINHLF
jgi:hypothetical protein